MPRLRAGACAEIRMIKQDFAQKLKDKVDGKDGKKPPKVRCVMRRVCA